GFNDHGDFVQTVDGENERFFAVAVLDQLETHADKALGDAAMVIDLDRQVSRRVRVDQAAAATDFLEPRSVVARTFPGLAIERHTVAIAEQFDQADAKHWIIPQRVPRHYFPHP